MMTGHAAPSGPAFAYTGPPISSVAKRIHGWSWQAFPISMGTSAVYMTLASLHDHPKWVNHLELLFFFVVITLFLLNTSTLLLQFLLYRRQSLRLLFDPVKGIFVPLAVLSFATIIIGTINYAVPKQISVGFIYAVFWAYVILSVLICIPMLMIWFNQPHEIKEFTPAYAFLVFPMMLVGIVAMNVLRILADDDPRAVGVLLVGYFFQGIGFFMTFFYLTLYVLRVFTTGFLDGHQANGAFVACGPPGFTALALIKLGQKAQTVFPNFGFMSSNAGEIWYAGSVLFALMLFGLAVFFFVFGVLPYWFKLHKHLHQILGCWAITFPNVGWINTLKVLGDIFEIRAFWVLHTILAVTMALAWFTLFSLTALAFYRGKILMSDDVDVAVDSIKDPEARAALLIPVELPSGIQSRVESMENIEKATLDTYFARPQQYDIERPAPPPAAYFSRRAQQQDAVLRTVV